MKKECVTYFSQFISVKIKKIFKKAQSQFWEKLRLRKKDGFF